MQDDDRASAAVSESDRCLLRTSALLALSQPDAAGFLQKRASISGWYRFWFSLHGSQLMFFEVATDARRGPLAGVISLFRNSVSVPSIAVSASKRKRELDLVDAAGKTHVLRADSDAQLHWWIQVFAIARNKIPPAKPFVPPPAPPPAATTHNQSASVAAADAFSSAATGASAAGRDARSFTCASASVAERQSMPAAGSADTSSTLNKTNLDASPKSRSCSRRSQSQKQIGYVPPAVAALQSVAVEDHLPVDHVLCIVHGIGASDDVLSDNVTQLQESYAEVANKVFPDLNFRVELLVVHWRHALTSLDVHKKLQAVVPIAPNLSGGEGNPLRQFMVHRAVDYVYYTHERYRRHVLREVSAQLNASMADFRRRRPDFDGHISIFAHSLGAALAYDLLCRKEHDDKSLLAAEGVLLDFEVSNLFMGGSPLGTFLHLDPTLALGADIRRLPFRIYNMYHPNDPIATRLEPYMDPRFVGVTPVVIPYWSNMGIRSSTAQWLGTLWGSKQKAAAGQPTPQGSIDAANTSVPLAEPNIVSGAGNGTAHGTADDGVVKINGGLAQKLVASAGGLIRPASMHDDIASTDSADSAKIVDASLAAEMEMIGLVGKESELQPRYFSQAAQDEIRASLGHERRYDYVLQLSSTMEEVSTAWSALRAHTYYWGSTDIMLLMMSSMIKTTHGISDSVSHLPSHEVDQHLIDERANMKPSARFGRSWSEDASGDHASLSLLPASSGRPSSSRDSLGADVALEDAVQCFVDKLVDETAAMHELATQHPHVRMRWGGITRSTSHAKGSEAAAEALRRAVAECNGSKSTEVPAPSGYASWASYIPWFGKDDTVRPRVSGSGKAPDRRKK
jgi:hypothetical protein